MKSWLIKIGAMLALAASLTGCGYNDFQRLDETTKSAWSEVVNQYQRRADLIDNLVNTVKGYATHERGVFEEVTRARAGVEAVAGQGTVADRAAAEERLDRAIFNVLAVAENYPDLKASANFLHLQEQLADTENQLAFSRQYYNDAVATLNKKVVTIPWLLFTGIAGVSKREFYRAPAGQDVPPQVQF